MRTPPYMYVIQILVTFLKHADSRSKVCDGDDGRAGGQGPDVHRTESGELFRNLN